MSQVRERLHTACDLAKQALASSQESMKCRFDQKAVQRSFNPGDQVLVLLPVPGSSLSARFTGPYVIDKKLSVTDFVVRTPDRRRKSRGCHINMLKLYNARQEQSSVVDVPSIVAANH